MEKPTNIPRKGFYYHYKHDPKKDFNNYAYEVIGTALHSEERNYTVLYRPLYPNTFLAPANYVARPLGMFMEQVKVGGEVVPRFRLIANREVIERLEKIKAEMY